MRVLVTGASGCIGRATAAALVGRGVAVRALSRRLADGLPSAVEQVAGDIRDTRAMSAALQGVDAVVHLAATAHTVPRSARELDDMRAVNVDATRALGAAAARMGIAHRILASTVAVYGESSTGDAVTETAACEPTGPYGRGKLDADMTWREIGGVALRLALVFGPYDRGNVATLFRQVAAGRVAVLGVGANRKSLAFVDNIADRILAILSMDAAALAGEAFNVADYAPTQAELLDAVARALGRSPPPRLPPQPFAFGARALDRIERLRGRAPRWADRVRKLMLSTEYDSRRLDGLLDYRPRTSLDQGLSAVAAYLRASGSLR